ncbi:MAG TPA: cell division protein CrgA [Acidimicrobiales bacterium]|nr:cell division protein CrgA [Acidimicrobiales bacterium]
MPETTSGEGDPTTDPTDLADEGDEPAEAGGEDDEAEEGARDDASEGPEDEEGLPETPTPKSRRTIRDAAAAQATSTAASPPRSGRATPKGGASKQASRPGRYTPPIPKEKRQSPRWFGPALLGFLILGLLTIVLNYVNVLPGGTSNWYLISGIVLIVIGLFMATFYH